MINNQVDKVIIRGELHTRNYKL